MSQALLAMGVTGRPHGIKGEISVDWHGATIPDPGNVIYLQAGDSEPVPWQVVSSRRHNGKLLLTLDGVRDRDKADSLKCQNVLVPRSVIPQPEDGEAFVQDLPGWNVYTENGEHLGIIDHVEYPGGQLIWSILDQAKNEILFPAEPRFIISLNTKKREAVIDPPPGLLEIYRA